MLEPSLSLARSGARRFTVARGAARRRLGALAGVVAAALLSACAVIPPLPSQPVTNAAVAPSPTPASPAPTIAVLPDPQILATKLNKVSRAGIGTSGMVILDEDGQVLSSRGDKAMAPASTMKLFTALAAVDVLGADHRFTTRVVDAGDGQIVLVGGGDPLLTDKQSAAAAKPASLEALAKATAAALSAKGIQKVRLGYDSSLFTGPNFSPHWKASWGSYLARTSPLLIGEGLITKWQADPKPAAAAAKAFAAQLKSAGITVTKVGAAKAAGTAAELAAVDSAPVSTIVARTLRLSDNLAAEVLARHVAIAAGQEASFDGAAAALKGWLVDHGLWVDGMRILDGSGLAKKARVTPGVLARAVDLSLRTERLSVVAAQLPVAGVNGTMKARFNDKSEKVARGNVHAKTGTLVGIASLAGWLTTADGARLTFAAMANDAVGQTTAYNWLDRSVATVVRCGCR